jgi:hypothetical protein
MATSSDAEEAEYDIVLEYTPAGNGLLAVQ